MERAQGETDLTAATTSAHFKCVQCGNMYPTRLEACDVCGFPCSETTCAIVCSSDQDY